MKDDVIVMKDRIKELINSIAISKSLNNIEEALHIKGRDVCATLTQEKLIKLRHRIESLQNLEKRLSFEKRLNEIDKELNKDSTWVKCLKYRDNMAQRRKDR